MIAWILAVFVPAPLIALDGWLAGSDWPAPDLTVALGVYLALFIRQTALPAFLVLVGIARGLLLPGDGALHVLAMGAPVALLLPVRGIVFRRNVLVQAGIAVALALLMPRVGQLLGRLGGDASAYVPEAIGWIRLAEVAVLVPLAVWLLRRLPPFAQLEERSE